MTERVVLGAIIFFAVLSISRAHDVQSMFADAIAVYMLDIKALTGDPPPEAYDHPYDGPVEIKHDLPKTGSEQQGFAAAASEPPTYPGQTCIIHVWPMWKGLGRYIMEPVGLARLIRHEMGHCNGLEHPTINGHVDVRKWVPRRMTEDDRARVRRWIDYWAERPVPPLPRDIQ